MFTINNYIGNTNKIINADGAGYYDYLKSIFYHKDFVRYKTPINSNPDLYHRISSEPLTGSYVEIEGYKVNKYPPGTAILLSPFFLYGYFTLPIENNYNDGYQDLFQKLVFYAALFYLFLGLIYTKKLLRLFEIEETTIFIIQLAIVFSTSITRYAHADAAYSHVYSFFAINAFLYYCKKYFITNHLKHVALASVFLGLIILIRNINIFVILFTPFLAADIDSFFKSLRNIFTKLKFFVTVLVCFLPCLFIQLLSWRLQTGKWYIYSYGKEGFNFSEPHFADILFSYQKGLFVYHPVLVLSLLGLMVLFKKKNYFHAVIWMLFFTFLTYILSSWWTWIYGCSYGQRVYIDYFIIFFILIALALNQLKLTYSIVIVLLVLFSCINIIQTYQYKEYILHWEQMDKEKYWKVFLKTHPKYGGLLWTNKNIKYELIKKLTFNNTYHFVHNNDALVIDTLITDSTLIPAFNAINLNFYNPIDEEDNSKILLEIRRFDNNEIYYSHEVYLAHFENEGFNKMQLASYLFKFDNITEMVPYRLIIYCKTEKSDVIMNNLNIEFIKT